MAPPRPPTTPLPVGIFDGDVGAAAVKAPSTPAVATDKSLVVSLSPNNPITISGPVTVTGGLTNTELRASPVPVSGTVTANVGTGTQPISAAALPLPTGASTSALQTQPGVDIGDVTVNNAAGAAAVNIQDGGNSITVDGTVAVSGSVAVTGPLTDAQLRATAVPVSLASTTITGSVAVTGPLTDAQLRATPVPVSGTVATGGLTDAQLRASAVPVTANAGTNLNTSLLALEATQTSRAAKAQITDGTRDGTVKAASTAAVATDTAVVVALSPNNSPTVTQGTANTNANAWPVKEVRAATGTLTNVASSATSVTLLASNASRLGAAIFNDSVEKLYVKLGATASITSFTLVLDSQCYCEIPFNYTGLIDGIWPTATGTARVTEVTI